MEINLAPLLPEWFREIEEFKELIKIENMELEELEEALRRIRDNQYIMTCDGETLAKHEKRLGITASLQDTPELRRERILQKYNTIVPFSVGFLKNRLIDLYGEDGFKMRVNAPRNTLVIDITSDRRGALTLLNGLLEDVLPAHVKAFLSQTVTKEIEEKLYTVPVVAKACVQSV